jgi:hypothetical protein
VPGDSVTHGETCTCAAAVAGDPVCSHRAVVRYVLSTLPAVVVSVSDLIDAGAANHCRRCFGKGAYWMGSPADGDSRWTLCPVCSGDGFTVTAPQQEAA